MNNRGQTVNMQFSKQLGKLQRTGKKHMRDGSAGRCWTAHHGPSPLVRGGGRPKRASWLLGLVDLAAGRLDGTRWRGGVNMLVLERKA